MTQLQAHQAISHPESQGLEVLQDNDGLPAVRIPAIMALGDVAHREQLLPAVGGQQGRQVAIGVDLVAEGLLATVQLAAREARNLSLHDDGDW